MFDLPKLPYDKAALMPYLSNELIDYHYGKHHKAYVDNLNRLITEQKFFQNTTLEEIIQESVQDSKYTAFFNNAAQIWNHTFYWESMKPNGGGRPSGALLETIEKKFQSFELFVKKFKEACNAQFGSGWVFLIWDRNELIIMKTTNADTPIAYNKKAILTCDVWEHAYYIDYRNRRAEYVDVFFEHLINWHKASDRFLEVL